ALKWSLSPLRLFSDDLIKYMFEVLVLDGEISPWILMKLWTRIIVDANRSNGFGRRLGGRENCCTAKHLRGILRLSGEAPLDISVRMLSEEMAALLVAERWRWERLEFFNEPLDPLTAESLTDEAKALFVIPNESLSIKEASFFHVSDISVASWAEAARPQSLSLNFSSIEPFVSIKWWDSLQVLNIQGFEEFTLHGPSVYAILSAVRIYLVGLSISECNLEDQFTEVMEFPKLRDLSLVSVSHWWMMSAPQVVSLCLEPQDPAPPGTKFSYLQLKKLSYRADKVPLLGDTIYCPQLESISLTAVASTKPGENLIWCTAEGELSSMAAKEIHIEGAAGIKDIKYKDLITSLRPHNGLEKLKITYIKLPVLFYKAFLRPGTKKKLAPLCPALRDLEVDLQGVRATIDATQYDQVFQELVQEREKSASPLTRLYVRWPGYDFKPTNYTNGETLTKEKFELFFGSSSDDDSDRYPDRTHFTPDHLTEISE
ncbi:14926_t:CDS:2, partial [Acaulospora colombiana]